MPQIGSFTLPRNAVCPVDGCEVTGSIPGVRRHVQARHGKALPPGITDATVTLWLEKFNQQPVKELRAQAKAAGIKGWHALRKDDLVARLAAHANAS
jgi:hypothetical protein